MTEEEAKTKACCGSYMIAAAIATADYSRTGAPRPDAINGYCIGSACMAWRWETRQTNPVHPMMAVSMDYQPIYEATDQGFCGLARAPR
jgi:hypothetical protein